MDRQIQESIKANLEKHQVSKKLREKTIKKIMSMEDVEKESKISILNKVDIKRAGVIVSACALGLFIGWGLQGADNRKTIQKSENSEIACGVDANNSIEKGKDNESMTGIAMGKYDPDLSESDADNKTSFMATGKQNNEAGSGMDKNYEDNLYGGNDNSSINYDSLRFAETTPIGFPQDSYAQAKVTGFSEAFLKNTVLTFKGTVKNIYFKDYKYQVYDNKFKEDDKITLGAQAIVYEVEVDDILYSQENVQVGDIIKIEDIIIMSSFDEGSYPLKVNQQYIIPVKDAGDTIVYKTNESENAGNGHRFGEYAGGDITRDGKYMSFYAYAPQIEVTLDNQYLFHDKWTSLINDKTRNVIIDNQETSYYKLKLREDDGFIEDLKKLIEKYK